jgi:ElaB/YqjD/DUF883 family membrane-anchored ribosome-binding protein
MTTWSLGTEVSFGRAVQRKPFTKQGRMAVGEYHMAQAETSKRSDASIDDQLAQLRDDLKVLTNSVTQLASDRASEAGEQIRDRVRDGADRVRDGAERARAQGQQAAERTVATVEENPVTSMLVAFGVGLAVGMWSRR